MTRDWQDFRGTSRFRVERRLGAGAFGVVYQALDQEHNTIVALKTLQRADPRALYQLKREFRSLADITHPNLVTLHELHSEGNEWFIAMEYVDGSSFLHHVQGVTQSRTGPTPASSSLTLTRDLPATVVDGAQGTSGEQFASPLGPTSAHLPALRSALRQLAEGLSALHAAGKLHRDLKPSNVLVTDEGRVVILDFGLITELDPDSQGKTMTLSGTPGYMSPEQAAGRPIHEASDWYGVGVMLFEALVGQRPFADALSSQELLARKQTAAAPTPSHWVTGVPEDLDQLCAAMLQPDPAARPSASDILERLGSGSTPAIQRAARQPTLARDVPFIGRADFIEQLMDDFRTAKAGRGVTVYLHGSSGLGKTTLVHHFLNGLRSQEPDVVILTGRCYERESVPYKALDSLVDSLTQYLRGLPEAEAQAVLPRDVLLLGRLFPVLLQVPAVTNAQRRIDDISDSRELRRRSFAALRELMARIAAQHPTVLFIDDLHWGDADSTASLSEMLSPPDPPALLLIITYRSEEVETSPSLQALLDMTSGPQTEVRELALHELSNEESEELATALLSDQSADLMARSSKVARESGGSPFFLTQLVEHAAEDAGRGSAREDTEYANLDQMLQSRIDRLPDQAHRLLELLSVAGQPVPLKVSTRACDLTEGSLDILTALLSLRFVRTRTTPTDLLEPYHARIREAILARLAPDTVRRHHRHLASAYEAVGGADPETLALHYQGAGEPERAAEHAIEAAARAEEALAFDHAARLYRLTLDLRPADVTTTRETQVRLGRALANAGRGAEAAEAFLASVDGAPRVEAIELQRLAAQQLLLSGRLEEGLAAVRSVLSELGLNLPRSPRRALLSFLLGRLWLRLRGSGYRERDASELPPLDLVRVDTCWTVVTGLRFIDTILAIGVQHRQLVLALRAGEPFRVSRALAFQINLHSVAGTKSWERTQKQINLAGALARKANDPYSIGVVTNETGMAWFVNGHWKKACELCDQAERIFREQCAGVPWDLDVAHLFSLISLLRMGNLEELRRRLPGIERDARERGDLFMRTFIDTEVQPRIWLADDEAERALSQVTDGIGRWTYPGFHRQHQYALHARVDILLYRGDGAGAWRAVEDQYPALERSLLLRQQYMRMTVTDYRTRAALAAAVESEGDERQRLLRFVDEQIGVIEREDAFWSQPLAALLRGGLASVRGAAGEGLAHLADAEAGFEAADMTLHAAAARRRRGQLGADEAGPEMVAAADQTMREHDIANPERWANMLSPGAWS